MIRKIIRGLGWSAASTGAKLVFGFVLSVVTLVKADAGVAAMLFQLLLLQAAVTQIVGGSAFPRGLALNNDIQKASAFAKSSLLLSGAVSLFLTGIVLGFGDLLGKWHIGFSVIEILLVCLGAVATCIHSLLQGFWIARHGPARVFAPTAVANAVASFAAFLYPQNSVTVFLALVLICQIMSLVLLVLWNWRESLAIFKSAGAVSNLYVFSLETLVFGSVNTSYLIAFLLVRAAWQKEVSAELSAYAFFAMRISDTVSQIVFYAFAERGELLLAKASNWHTSLFQPIGAMLIGVLLLGAAIAVLSLSLAVEGYALAGFLAGQLILDLFRMPVSLISILSMRYGLSRLYGVLVVSAIAGSAICFILVLWILPTYALFVFQMAYAVIIAFGWKHLQDHVKTDPGIRRN